MLYIQIGLASGYKNIDSGGLIELNNNPGSQKENLIAETRFTWVVVIRFFRCFLPFMEFDFLFSMPVERLLFCSDVDDICLLLFLREAW